MKKSNILAHRGYWKNTSEKNTYNALRLALEKSYGIETDVRDFAGKLVISHDPPSSNDLVTFDDFLKAILETKSSGRIALNIKADGLNEKIHKRLEEKFDDISKFFAFDMSLPDTLLYRKSSTPFYTRVSEYETDLYLFPDAIGVWVDDFTGNFDQLTYTQKILEMGKRVAFVSPELHGRRHQKTWDALKTSGVHKNNNFELCTDYPDAAHDFFSEER